MKKRCVYLLIMILHMQLIQDLTQPVCKEPWLKYFPLNCHFSFTFYQHHFTDWNHMNKLKFQCRQSFPWVILLQQNNHSAALPNSQSIIEIFIFWLHCTSTLLQKSEMTDILRFWNPLSFTSWTCFLCPKDTGDAWKYQPVAAGEKKVALFLQSVTENDTDTIYSKEE